MALMTATLKKKGKKPLAIRDGRAEGETADEDDNDDDEGQEATNGSGRKEAQGPKQSRPAPKSAPAARAPGQAGGRRVPQGGWRGPQAQVIITFLQTAATGRNEAPKGWSER